MSAFLARFVVVVAGAAILVVETLATRLVAPYVGLTLESTTAAIGVALAGIAVGAAVGGRMADTLSPRRVAAGALALGGLGVLAVRPLVNLLGPVFGPGPVAALLLVGFSTVFPVAVLAVVSPALTKARLEAPDAAGPGAVVGGLSAAGTVGSLAGVFVTGFVLVAFLPVSVILIGTAVACLLAALLVARPVDRTRHDVGRGAAAAVVLGAALVAVPGPCAADTTYHCARVLDEGGDRRSLVLDDLRHSVVDLDDPLYLQFSYARRFAATVDAAFGAGAPVRAVHVGGGGFTMPRYLAAARPGSTSVVLELDRGVVELGRRELGVDAIPGLDVRVGDARTGLAGLPTDSADLVVGDAFGARAVPWHLATTQFVAEIDRVLAPGGVYVLNVIDGPPAELVAAELATMRASFPHVRLLAAPAQRDRREGGNYVLVAGDVALDQDALATALAARDEPGTAMDEPATATFAGDAQRLTDDHAPVDRLQS